MSVESSLREVTRLIEQSEQGQTLDQLADQLQSLIRTAVEQGGPAARRLKNWLHGTWLGHPLHPALTDVPIGAWTVAFLLDVVGAEEQADAAMTIGALAAVPTALAGAADWSDMDPPARRVGLVHALLNTFGLSCIIASLFARRNDNRALGVGLSTAGLSVASFSAWLGGSLVYREGIGVSHNAFEPGVDEFQPVLSADSLEPGKLTYAELNTDGGRVPLVLYKSGASIYALSNVCSHLGGPLAEGKVVDGNCVECPWHASQFRLSDGTVRQGPASVPQPLFETRVSGGQIEVRRVR
jgi:nitrite reductase/ring-hydroxylating ferredoxin subunit/uncharacterized membrane protein